MTVAWYGHLKFKTSPIFLAIVVSWGIAFVEYCFAVPANRMGNAVYSPAELKSIQEVITLIVFAGFTAIYFREPLTLIQGAGFAFIALGAVLVFKGNACRAQATGRIITSACDPERKLTVPSPTTSPASAAKRACG